MTTQTGTSSGQMWGPIVAQWEHAWVLYSEQFVKTGREYGRKLSVRVTHDTFVELHYLLSRFRSVGTSVEYSNTDGIYQGHITYTLPAIGEIKVTPHKEVSLYTDRPTLPSTAAAVYVHVPTFPNDRLICVFDFGFNINDVCIHEGERIRDFLSHKGLSKYPDTQLGREAAQKDQLEKMFSERAHEADWNF